MMVLGSILLGGEVKVNHYPIPIKVVVEKRIKLTVCRKVMRVSTHLKQSCCFKVTVRRVK